MSKNKKRPTKYISIHRVWHDFLDKFGSVEEWNINDQDSKLLTMKAIRKWARQYPEDVFINYVDDISHACSDIIFILHRNEFGENWGTSVIVITQCDSQHPCCFFMYPSHLKCILKTLSGINNMEEIYG